MALMFDTVLTQSGLANNSEITGTFGPKTLVFITSTSNLTFVGINPIGGPVDKQVVCCANITNASFSHQFAHESGLASLARNRLLNPSLSTINTGTGIGGVWYVWNSGIQRWVCISRTS